MSLKTHHIASLILLALLLSGHCHNPTQPDTEQATEKPAAAIDSFNVLIMKAQANSDITTAKFRAEINQIKKERNPKMKYLIMDRNADGDFDYYPLNNQNIIKQ